MDTAPRYLEYIICCIWCLSTVRFLTLDRQQRVGVLDPLERPRHPQLSSAYLDMATLLQIQTHFYMEDLSWHYTCGGTVHFCQVRISEIPEHIDHHRHRATGLPKTECAGQSAAQLSPDCPPGNTLRPGTARLTVTHLHLDLLLRPGLHQTVCVL